MPALLDSFAYRFRWARRSFLCHYRNRFPREDVLPERQVVDLHRRQKEDFQAVLGGEADAAAGQRAEATRLAVTARLALLDRPYRACLEIGCENGWFGRMLAGRGLASKVLGVDLRDEEMRGHAAAPVPLLTASAERLPIKPPRSGAPGLSGGFDLIAAFHVLEHIRAPESLRGELARLAAPGAHVMLAVPLGWDEDPCHRWHFMTPAGWKAFLKSRYRLTFLRGSVQNSPDAEFLALCRLDP